MLPVLGLRGELRLKRGCLVQVGLYWCSRDLERSQGRLREHEVVWLFRIGFMVLMDKDSFILLSIGELLHDNNSPIDSKMKESLYIKTTKPILNNQTTSCSLYLHYDLLRSHEHQYKPTYTRHSRFNLNSPPTPKTGIKLFNLCLFMTFL